MRVQAAGVRALLFQIFYQQKHIHLVVLPTRVSRVRVLEQRVGERKVERESRYEDGISTFHFTERKRLCERAYAIVAFSLVVLSPPLYLFSPKVEDSICVARLTIIMWICPPKGSTAYLNPCALPAPSPPVTPRCTHYLAYATLAARREQKRAK